jgi:tetratricopeptide (TPR) repeat protein
MRRKASNQDAATRRQPSRTLQSAHHVVTGWQLWALRAGLAVLTPLLLLVLMEAILRLAGAGHPAGFLLASRIEGQPVWIQNDRVTRPFFGRDLARTPFPLAMAHEKGRNTIRVFVFGESAAYGDPQPEFGLSRMLEALLSGRYPGAHFEVINAALTGINSHILARIARDCAPHQGDVWVIYMGNNEVVGPFGAGTVFGPRAPGLTLTRASIAFKESRTGQLLTDLAGRISKPSPQRREWGGMSMFLQYQVRQDAPGMATVYSNFQENLREMIHLGQRSGAKVLAGTVVSNLKDCAPFGSLHRPGLSAAELAEWDESYHHALDAQKNGRFAEAIGLLQQASRIDDSDADLQYVWGQCCLALGQKPAAREKFVRSRDLDVLRFRADSRINEIIRGMASGFPREAVRLVDAEKALTAHSPSGLVGNDLLYEHVHLRFEGNYLLARAFADAIGEMLEDRAQLRAAAAAWPSLEDCAARLGWTKWNERNGLLAMTGRMSEPPFTGQLDHDQRLEGLRRELEQLRPSVSAAGLGEARQQCQAALTRAPADWVLAQGLAAMQQAAGDFAGATASMRHVLRRLPHYVEGWQELGRNLLELKEHGEAATAFRTALRLEPDHIAALMGLAHAVGRLGRTEESIQLYEQVLRAKPYWSPAHLELGKLLQSAGQTEAAKEHFTRALESRLFTPQALRTLASFCFDQGWMEAACTNFADAVRLDPSDAATRVNWGLTLALLGRRTEAQAQFAEALRLDPGQAEAHVRLGFEFGRQGKDAEALLHFQEAVRLEPGMVEARLNLGIALVNQRRGAEALAQFQEVLRRHPTNAVALDYVRRLSSISPEPGRRTN